MIDIEKVEQYAEELKNSISEIKTVLIVVDDSQLSSKLSKIGKDDNLILVGFIPSHKIEGNDIDAVKTRDLMLWLVLKKAARANDDFVSTMKECQSACKKLIKKMLEDKPMFDNKCGLMRMLKIPSITVDPVWGLNSCDGYEIEYQLKTKLF
jgi:hypothetical protein